MNMKDLPTDEQLSRIFRAVSTPARIRILAGIGKGEACVCHLEALLDLRQAYISQQLMELRDVGLLETRREGRYIFYRLTEPLLFDLMIAMGGLLGISTDDLEGLLNNDPLPLCCCPDCSSQLKKPLIQEDEAS